MKLNQRNKMTGQTLLAGLDDESTKLVFLDPQYRAVLDKLKFGNEGARQKKRFALPQMSSEMISFFVDEALRILRPSGHLMLWLDKFSIVERAWAGWVAPQVDRFQPVDMISWRKHRIGMGRRSRNRTEFLLVLQKPPIRAKGCWTDHAIDDCWIEDADPTRHPHAKPLQLTQRLIRATTKRDDLVVDPAAGGYGVLEACLATGRRFVGCDVVDLDEAAT